MFWLLLWVEGVELDFHLGSDAICFIGGWLFNGGFKGFSSEGWRCWRNCGYCLRMNMWCGKGTGLSTMLAKVTTAWRRQIMGWYGFFKHLKALLFTFFKGLLFLFLFGDHYHGKFLVYISLE